MIKTIKIVAVVLICTACFAIKAYYIGKDSAEREKRTEKKINEKKIQI